MSRVQGKEHRHGAASICTGMPSVMLACGTGATHASGSVHSHKRSCILHLCALPTEAAVLSLLHVQPESIVIWLACTAGSFNSASMFGLPGVSCGCLERLVAPDTHSMQLVFFAKGLPKCNVHLCSPHGTGLVVDTCLKMHMGWRTGQRLGRRWDWHAVHRGPGR